MFCYEASYAPASCMIWFSPLDYVMCANKIGRGGNNKTMIISLPPFYITSSSTPKYTNLSSSYKPLCIRFWHWNSVAASITSATTSYPPLILYGHCWFLLDAVAKNGGGVSLKNQPCSQGTFGKYFILLDILVKHFIELDRTRRI